MCIRDSISREMNPMENVVCTIGLMNAGTRYNVGVEDAYDIFHLSLIHIYHCRIGSLEKLHQVV